MFGFHAFVEHDGFARSVIFLLFMTTVGCMSYTWGYWEGVSNAKSMITLDRLHLETLAQQSDMPAGSHSIRHGHHGSSDKNHTAPAARSGGHGLLAAGRPTAISHVARERSERVVAGAASQRTLLLDRHAATGAARQHKGLAAGAAAASTSGWMAGWGSSRAGGGSLARRRLRQK